jgi:hypothetical protein
LKLILIIFSFGLSMTHIQKAVEAIGNRGKYQKVLLAFFILVYMELGLMLIGSTFVFMNPQFQCPGMDDPSEGDACPIIEQCTIGTADLTQSMSTQPLTMPDYTVTNKLIETSFSQPCTSALFWDFSF